MDLDQLKDKDEFLYEQMRSQIDNYGQIPSQLFEKPHCPRLPVSKADIDIWPIASLPVEALGFDTVLEKKNTLQRPMKIVGFKSQQVSVGPILFIAVLGSKLITVDSQQIIGYHNWQYLKPDVVPPYALEIDLQALRASQGGMTLPRI